MSPPIFNPDGSEVSEIVLPDGSTASQVIGPDGNVVFEAGPDIPDSEADQKLIHRYYLGANEPFIDQIGDADATNNGTTEVSGDWVAGTAHEGNGTDAYIDLTTLGDFGGVTIPSNDGFSIAFSFKGTEGLSAGNGDVTIGSTDNDTDQYIQLPSGNRSTGEVSVRDDTGSQSDLSWSNASNYEDDNQHRIVYNIPDIGNVSTWEIYADQTSESVAVDRDETADSWSNFVTAILALARNARGTPDSYTNAIIDDICIFGAALTDSEAKSYDPPWA